LLDGRKLIIVGDVPGSSFVPAECFGQLRWFPISSSCTVQDPVNRHKASIAINKILAKYAKQQRNTYFINSYDAFCSDQFCRSVSATGVPYYSDSSHLSKTGSDVLIKKFKLKIMHVLFG
jgi:hypothetical protein